MAPDAAPRVVVGGEARAPAIGLPRAVADFPACQQARDGQRNRFRFPDCPDDFQRRAKAR